MCAAATKRGRRERWSRAPGSRLGLGDVQRRVSDHCWDGAHAGVHRGGRRERASATAPKPCRGAASAQGAVRARTHAWAPAARGAAAPPGAGRPPRAPRLAGWEDRAARRGLSAPVPDRCGPPGLGARRRCRIRGAASGMGVGLSQEVSAAPEGVGIQKAAQGSQQQEKNRDALRFGRPLCPRGGGAQAGSCSRKFAAGRLRGPASRGCRGTHTGDIATRVTHRGGIATPVG
ncbi:MAG: hypothetical protein J3K34DRAFT_189511 [Monoraphidium minutum]|nr:MAG: hypothetical protein J3K34DRAFT_189511 [Monoraphidium minutum]